MEIWLYFNYFQGLFYVLAFLLDFFWHLYKLCHSLICRLAFWPQAPSIRSSICGTFATLGGRRCRSTLWWPRRRSSSIRSPVMYLLLHMKVITILYCIYKVFDISNIHILMYLQSYLHFRCKKLKKMILYITLENWILIPNFTGILMEFWSYFPQLFSILT